MVTILHQNDATQIQTYFGFFILNERGGPHVFHFSICAFPFEKSLGNIYAQRLEYWFPEKKKITFAALLQIFSASKNFVVIFQYCRIFFWILLFFIWTSKAVIVPLVHYTAYEKQNRETFKMCRNYTEIIDPNFKRSNWFHTFKWHCQTVLLFCCQKS